MPRQYGLSEIQRVIDIALELKSHGVEDVSAEQVLHEMGVWHPRNRNGDQKSWFQGAQGMHLAGPGGCNFCLAPPAWPHEEGCKA